MAEADIERLLEEYRAVQGDYADFARRIDSLLRDICAHHDIDYAAIEAREKEVPSLGTKLRRSPRSSLSEVTDLCGGRVIVFQLSDVGRMVAAVESEFEVLERQEHGAEHAESFGYRSVHLLVRPCPPRTDLPEWSRSAGLVAEIQVRTVLQHAWAGISHKLDYKNVASVPAEVRRKLFRVAALLETGDEVFDEFLREVTDLKAGYEQAVEDDAWTLLPINRDSIEGAWDHLPWDIATAVGREAGLAETEFDWNAPFHVADQAGHLSVMSAACGLATLGDLDAFIRDVLPGLSDDLGRFATQAIAAGKPAYNVPPAVVMFVLALGHPGVIGLFGDIGLRDDLVTALRAVVDE